MRRLTQPLSFSYYYYSPWQPSPFLSSRRNETPFRPGPHGLQAPTLSLSLSLSSLLFLFLPRFFTDPWTRWFIHSASRGPRQVSVIVFSGSREEEEEGKRERVPGRRIAGQRGKGSLVGFRRNPPVPEMGPIVLLATNR